MEITLCLLVGTLFVILFLYNKFFWKPPKIPNTIKATVIECKLSESRLAKKMREDNCPYNLYDVTYEWIDKNGETVQAMETRKYREEIGETKDMIIERKSNGHQELLELTTGSTQHLWIYLAIGLTAYAFIGFFFFNDMYPAFIPNLKKMGLPIIIGFWFLIGAMFFFEKFTMYKKLLLDTKVTQKFDATIFKITPVLKKNGKPSKYSTLTYKYTDNEVEKIFEDDEKLKLKKGIKIGDKKEIYIDKKTGELMRLQTALSCRTAGAAMTTVALCLIFTFLIKAIVMSM